MGKRMRIRTAKEEDIQEICRIYDLAREHMRAEGNTLQWKKYPNEKDALEDLRDEALYVMEEREIVGAFSFFIGEEKNSRKIEGEIGEGWTLTAAYIDLLLPENAGGLQKLAFLIAWNEYLIFESIRMRRIFPCKKH